MGPRLVLLLPLLLNMVSREGAAAALLPLPPFRRYCRCQYNAAAAAAEKHDDYEA
jgi:hypothetical protein